MTTRIWTKPQTQETLKALRQYGYTVNKTPQGYSVTNPKDNDNIVMTCLNGHRNYLVTYTEGLIT
jgi:phosphopantothenoylcysteine synthetase/decarboxylase